MTSRLQKMTRAVRLAELLLLSRPCSTHHQLSFSDHQAAFRSKRTSELVRAAAILAACCSDTLVDNSLTLLRTGERVLGSRVFSALMRRTFYEQFVAGEAGPAVPRAASALRRQGLRLMVAPALEADPGDARAAGGLLDRNVVELLRLADLATGDDLPCLQLKMSALVPAELLVSMSRLVSSLDERQHTLLVESLAGSLQSGGASVRGLSDLENDQLGRACRRLHDIGCRAGARRVRLLVDMEWSNVNPACSVLALAMMAAFNSREPAVCSTVQCYLRGALDTLAREQQAARRLGVCYGVKLVRGAYLERERQLAPGGVCASYLETGRNYDKAVVAGLEGATGPGRHFLVVATHNEAAVLTATRLLGDDRPPNVAFAQIYGMAEHISLPLAQAGYAVYKSVAFGTLSQVLPYLARRAAENRAVLRGARRERELLRRELGRRARAALGTS